ncbi:MAG: RNA 2',3'-cyclic phosphodiesterase [Candidatus Staskawiczbacteria bacterium]|nr:RNA 2',3'-cyclic phosphodiesterase [Candidatus Staskawiczbacteria bacterium]
MEKRHRVFIAINLPEDVKRALAKYQEKWSELPAKWTANDNLHITLEFLGQLTDVEVGGACKIVAEVSKCHSPFAMNLVKVLYGPPPRQGFAGRAPKFVWVNGERSDELADLKNDLEESLLEKISFRPDGKGFTPHITLARILEWEFRKFEIDERPEINEDIDILFTVESIEVMESKLKRGGPVYTILESHQFGL